MQIILDLPDEMLKQLLNLPEPEQFAKEAIVKALHKVTDEVSQQIDDKDDNSDPAQAFMSSGFVGCAEGDAKLSQNYKERLTEYLAEKHDYR